MTKEQKIKAAQKCAEGRRSCAGCNLDAYCPMVERLGKTFAEFLAKIDPGNSIRITKV